MRLEFLKAVACRAISSPRASCSSLALRRSPRLLVIHPPVSQTILIGEVR